MAISIIIVHYHVADVLWNCLQSVYKSKTKRSFEVIVVDNDENPTIEKKLVTSFPHIRYIHNERNSGYSGGNNLGAAHAKGTYLFFLNPDTLVDAQALEVLVTYLERHADVSVAAPVLYDKKGKPYTLQGTKELTPFRAICALSFVQKVFPTNAIANEYWNKKWNKKTPKEVDVVPGSAFLIRKEVFERLGQFDPSYFLFFEEHDLCNRVRKTGKKIVMLPDAKVIHLWGESTKKSRHNIKEIFEQSRFYYFKKFYGFPKALVTEVLLRFSKTTGALIGILLISVFLRFYLLEKTMVFIGDIAWFYLSARDMLLYGNIPLVGIASSHPWIHQGAFWTYLLAPYLFLTNFHPLSGGYLAASIGVVTAMLVYFFTKRMFNNQTALFSAAFFATSPLVVLNSRMPYHTAPIPLFVLLYIYSLFRWMQGSVYHFPLALFFLVVLYNFELASVMVASSLFFVVGYGFFKKTHWFESILNKKILSVSVISVLIPLLPMLLYDVGHNFPQTIRFGMWLGYRVLVLVGYPPLHPEIPSGTYQDMLSFFLHASQLFYYAPQAGLAAGIGVASIAVLLGIGYFKKTAASILLTISTILPILVIFAGKTPSEAYLPILFVQLAITIGLLFYFLTTFLKNTWIVYLLFFLLISANMYTIVTQRFFTTPAGTFIAKKSATEQLLQLTDGKPYAIQGKGVGSQFSSFTMPYEYLSWWMGYPAKENTKQVITIKEDIYGIHVYK